MAHSPRREAVPRLFVLFLAFLALRVGAPKRAESALAARVPSGQSAPEEGPRLFACGENGPALALSGGAVREWPSGAELHLDAALRPTAAACDGAQAAVGAVDAASGKDARIVLFRRAGGAWTPDGEIALRGATRAMALWRGRIAATIERGRELSLTMMDAAPGSKGLSIPLSAKPSALAVSPDGDRFLVAIGSNVRSYFVADGRTWMIFPFPEPVGALASSPGAARLLIAQGRAVVAVDPRDRAVRGVLPERARTELPGPAVALAWTGDGSVAAALVRESSSLVFLSGNDLSIIERRECAASTIVPVGPGRVVWLPAHGGDEAPVETALAPGIVATVHARVRASKEKEAAAAAAILAEPPDDPASAGAAPTAPPAARQSSPTAAPEARQSSPQAPPSPARPPTVPPATPSESPRSTAQPPPVSTPAAPSSSDRPPPQPPTTPAPKAGPRPPPPDSQQQRPPNAPQPIPPSSNAAQTPPPTIATDPRPQPSPSSPSADRPAGSPLAPPSSTAEPAPSPPSTTSPSTTTTPSAAPTRPPPTPSAVPSSPAAPTSPIQPSEPTTPPSTTAPSPPTSAANAPSPPATDPAASRDTARPSSEVPPASPSMPPAAAALAPGASTADPGAPAPAPGAPVPAPSEPAAAPGNTAPAPGGAASDSALPGGTIRGRIAGRPDLVEYLLVLGPDSLVTERARLVPTRTGDAALFLASGLPPGRYRIIPMGRGGASLAARPRFATVIVSAETGGRADFTVDGSL